MSATTGEKIVHRSTVTRVTKAGLLKRVDEASFDNTVDNAMVWNRLKDDISKLHNGNDIFEVLQAIDRRIEGGQEALEAVGYGIMSFIESKDVTAKLTEDGISVSMDHLQYSMKASIAAKEKYVHRLHISSICIAACDAAWPQLDWKAAFSADKDSSTSMFESLRALATKTAGKGDLAAKLVGHAQAYRLLLFADGQGRGRSPHLHVIRDDIEKARSIEASGASWPSAIPAQVLPQLYLVSTNHGTFGPSADAPQDCKYPTRKKIELFPFEVRQPAHQFLKEVRASAIVKYLEPSRNKRKAPEEVYLGKQARAALGISSKDYEEVTIRDIPPAEPEGEWAYRLLDGGTSREVPVLTSGHTRRKFREEYAWADLEVRPAEGGVAAFPSAAVGAGQGVWVASKVTAQGEGIRKRFPNCACPSFPKREELLQRLEKAAPLHSWESVLQLVLDSRGSSLCLRHVYLLGHKCNLNVLNKLPEQVQTYISRLWNDRATLGNLLANPNNESMFLNQVLFASARDKHGPHVRFPMFSARIVNFDPATILQRILDGTKQQVYDKSRQWSESGWARHTGEVEWLNNTLTKDAVRELEMFRYHTVETIEEFQPLYAHSVVAQALYQDPLLWMLNVAYRGLYGDREYRMIAYPTHALQVQNNSTFGIHANLAALQHNKGGAIIRSWIALQKEALPVNEAGRDAGPWVAASHFPRRFRKWMHEFLAEGGEVTMDKFFTPGIGEAELDSSALERISDDDDIGEKCVIVSSPPMGPGGISMHRACVPAGFDASNHGKGYWAGHTLLRIVSDDAMTAENDLHVKDLGAAHAYLSGPPQAENGAPVDNSAQCYRLPFATQLPSLGVLSDALVGRRSWTDSEVLREAQGWLNDPAPMLRYKNWCKKAVVAVKEGLKQEFASEEREMGKMSFKNWNWISKRPPSAVSRKGPLGRAVQGVNDAGAKFVDVPQTTPRLVQALPIPTANPTETGSQSSQNSTPGGV